jgi:type VI protein secretion system component VasF
MPRPSTIDRLPQEVRGAIARLREQGRTLDEILEHLRALDVEVSRSALGRHVQEMAKVGERLRRSRQVSEALARELGDAPESHVARINVELLHGFIYDFYALAEGEGEEADGARALLRNPKAMALFAEATERLTKASRHNADFVAKVEERATNKAKRDAATAVEAVAKARGISSETIDAIKAGVFGVRAP